VVAGLVVCLCSLEMWKLGDLRRHLANHIWLLARAPSLELSASRRLALSVAIIGELLDINAQLDETQDEWWLLRWGAGNDKG
jgi:hypothetical protein